MGGGYFFSLPFTPAINDDVRPLGTYEIKMAARNEKRSILTDVTKKKGDCEQYWGKHAQKPKQFNALSNIRSVARENTQHTQRALSLGLKSSLHGNSDSSSNFYNDDGTQILLF